MVVFNKMTILLLQTVHGRFFDARWSIPTLLHLGIGLPKAKFVHLSKPLPSPTVVMATSKKYFRRTLNVIASVQKFLPKLKIELYGIGMTKKQILTVSLTVWLLVLVY